MKEIDFLIPWKYLRLHLKIPPYLLSDKAVMKKRYFSTFNRMPNLSNPKLFNEKLMWRMLYDRRPLFRQLADKVEMRNYVKKKGLGRYLPKQFHVTDDPATIDFDILPDTFVVKPNHACNMIEIVHDKKKLDRKKLIQKCEEWLAINYYLEAREWQHKHIPRKIIVEEFLGINRSVPPEYKFHSFHGEPELVLVALDRYSKNHLEGWFNSDWIPQGLDTTMDRDVNIPKPDRLNELLNVARIFAKDFDYIRVDLYLLPDKIVLGELTVTAASGVGLRSNQVQQDLGDIWKLDTNSKTRQSILG